jgi:hypothetical protein
VRRLDSPKNTVAKGLDPVGSGGLLASLSVSEASMSVRGLMTGLTAGADSSWGDEDNGVLFASCPLSFMAAGFHWRPLPLGHLSNEY